MLLGAAPLGAGFHDGLVPALGIDPLSGFFLATIALVALPSLLYARDYLARRTAASAADRARRPLPALARRRRHGPRPVDLPRLLGADDAGPGGGDPRPPQDAAARHVVFVYLAITHLGGAGVWISLLTLAHYGALADPGALAAQGAGGAGAGPRRRPDRLRHQGRPDAAARLAAARPPGRARATSRR